LHFALADDAVFVVVEVFADTAGIGQRKQCVTGVQAGIFIACRP